MRETGDKATARNWRVMLQCLSSILAGKPERVDWSRFAPQDWQQFVQAAHTHRVAPLLWYTLDTIGWPDAFPMQVRNALHLTFYQTTAQNMLRYQELDQILTSFQKHDIPVVVLKGAVLAKTLYPHLGTRPMMDIDLLVPYQSLLRAAQVLRPLGYRKLAVQHDLVLYHTYHQHVDVELHWMLAYTRPHQYAFLNTWLWEHTDAWDRNQPNLAADEHAPYRDGTSSIYQFAPTAQMLALVAHVVVHHGYTAERLIWLYDLHLVLVHRQQHIMWDDLLACARAVGWDNALYTMLNAVQYYFDTPIPTVFFQTLAETTTDAARSGQETIGRHGKSDASVLSGFRVLNWTLQRRLLPLLIFPSAEYIHRRYTPQPDWLWPLYYLYRWSDLIGGGIRTLVRHPRSSEAI